MCSSDLTDLQKLGNFIRPRQTWFLNRLNASKLFVDTVNNLIAASPTPLVTDSSKISWYSYFNAEEPAPVSEVDYHVADLGQRDALIGLIVPGQTVLVDAVSATDNLWTVWQYNNSVTPWTQLRIQYYKVPKYWNYIDWYYTGYSNQTQVNLTVDTIADFEKLSPSTTGEIVKVLKKNTADSNSRYFSYLILFEKTLENGHVHTHCGENIEDERICCPDGPNDPDTDYPLGRCWWINLARDTEEIFLVRSGIEESLIRENQDFGSEDILLQGHKEYKGKATWSEVRRWFYEQKKYKLLGKNNFKFEINIEPQINLQSNFKNNLAGIEYSFTDKQFKMLVDDILLITFNNFYKKRVNIQVDNLDGNFTYQDQTKNLIGKIWKDLFEVIKNNNIIKIGRAHV